MLLHKHLPIPSSRALAAITLLFDFANLAILDPSSRWNHMVFVPGLADWHFIFTAAIVRGAYRNALTVL